MWMYYNVRLHWAHEQENCVCCVNGNYRNYRAASESRGRMSCLKNDEIYRRIYATENIFSLPSSLRSLCQKFPTCSLIDKRNSSRLLIPSKHVRSRTCVVESQKLEFSVVEFHVKISRRLSLFKKSDMVDWRTWNRVAGELLLTQQASWLVGFGVWLFLHVWWLVWRSFREKLKKKRKLWRNLCARAVTSQN